MGHVIKFVVILISGNLCLINHMRYFWPHVASIGDKWNGPQSHLGPWLLLSKKFGPWEIWVPRNLDPKWKSYVNFWMGIFYYGTECSVDLSNDVNLRKLKNCMWTTSLHLQLMHIKVIAIVEFKAKFMNF